MITEKEIAKIEQYLIGAVSDSERDEITQRIKDDPEYAAHVEMIKDMSVALKSDVKTFKGVLDSVMQPEPRKIVPLKKWLMVAAVFTGLIISYFLLDNSKPTDLYASYFEMPPENVIMRDDQVDPALSQAINAYKAAEYDRALAFFDRLEVKSPEVIFYSAMCLMAENRFTDALSLLQEIEGDAGSLESAVQWYLGLSQYQLGANEEARQRFLQLSREDGFYARKASEILDDI